MKQHYLPQGYLREFLDKKNGNKLHTLDISLLKYKKKVFDEPRYTAEVCRLKNFYTINPQNSNSNPHLKGKDPLFLEKHFQLYEQEYPKVITKIKNKQRALIKADAELLLYTFVDLKIRNPYFRDKVIDKNKEQMLEANFKGFMDEVESMDLSEFPSLSKESLINAINVTRHIIESDKNFAQSTHVSSLVLRREEGNSGIHRTIIDHLLNFEWTILLSDNKFITTDNPGVSLDSNERVQNTKFDADFFYFMPITPSLCLAITPHVKDFKSPKNKSQKSIQYRQAPDDLVESINGMHTYHVNRYIFSNNKETINSIAHKVNSYAGL